MARKDVPCIHVLIAAAECMREPVKETQTVFDLLTKWTGQPFKVCLRAVEREERSGFVEYGTSINFPWLTLEGHLQILTYCAGTGNALPKGAPGIAMYHAVVAAEEKQQQTIMDACRSVGRQHRERLEKSFWTAFLVGD